MTKLRFSTLPIVAPIVFSCVPGIPESGRTTTSRERRDGFSAAKRTSIGPVREANAEGTAPTSKIFFENHIRTRRRDLPKPKRALPSTRTKLSNSAIIGLESLSERPSRRVMIESYSRVVRDGTIKANTATDQPRDRFTSVAHIPHSVLLSVRIASILVVARECWNMCLHGLVRLGTDSIFSFLTALLSAVRHDSLEGENTSAQLTGAFI